jgi:hypothetical protein
MMRHLILTLIQVTSLIVAMTLLLVITVKPVQASAMNSVSANDGEQAEEVTWVCLALVGGAAILAVGMWMARLRRLLS